MRTIERNADLMEKMKKFLNLTFVQKTFSVNRIKALNLEAKDSSSDGEKP